MMIAMIDEKRPPGPDAGPDAGQDPWLDWKPQWTGKKKTPQDLQERHSPTEKVLVRLNAAKKLHQSQRRIVDARLWESMSPAEQEAAIAIAAAQEMLGRGMGYVTSNWQRIPGCSGPAHVSEIHARMMNAYIAWAEACAKRRLSHAMVLDVLSFGHSCRAVDRDRRLKNGATRDNLMKGLALYCELQGWR